MCKFFKGQPPLPNYINDTLAYIWKMHGSIIIIVCTLNFRQRNRFDHPPINEISARRIDINNFHWNFKIKFTHIGCLRSFMFWYCLSPPLPKLGKKYLTEVQTASATSFVYIILVMTNACTLPRDKKNNLPNYPIAPQFFCT